MLKTIKLYGNLAEKYGDEFRLDVQTPAEAVRALIVQLRGFEQDIRAGEFLCLRGSYDDGQFCDEELLHLRFGQTTDEFHLIPAVVGHAKSPIGKVLIGVLLIAAVMIPGMQMLGFGAMSALTSGTFTAATIGAAIHATGTLGMFLVGIGGLMILQGVAQMLSPTPSGGNSSTSPSYSFNGAVNTSQEGSACPLVFGRLICGSVIASAGITSERLGATGEDLSSQGDMVLATI